MARLFRYLKPVWLELTISIILLIGQVTFQLLVPDQMSGLSGYINDMAVSAPGLPEYEEGLKNIWIMGGKMLGSVVLTTICAILVNFFSSKVSTKVGENLRRDIFRKVNSLSLAEYEAFGVSSLITRTTNDVIQIQQFLLLGIRVMVSGPLTLVIAIIMILAKYDPFLTAVLAITVPILLVIVLVVGFKVMPLMKSMQKKIDRTTLILRENITGIRVIRAFNNQSDETVRYQRANRDLTNVNIKTNRIFGFLMPAVMFVMNTTLIGVYAVGFLSFKDKFINEVTAGFSQIMAVASYVMQVMMSLLMFVMIFMFLSRANVSAKRINGILDLPLSDDDFQLDEDTAKKLSQVHGEIEFKDVSFTFPSAKEKTLSNISFKCAKNTTTAIIGSTGSGKSTIINLIPRFYDATEGEILFDDVNIKRIPGEVVRSKISFVPQKALLFKGTIRDNLLFGNEHASDEELKEALRVSESLNFVMSKDKGLDAEVSQGGTNFSGGQRQRLCIARALVRKGEVYVFDDSFSALDFKTDVKVRTNLKEYTKDAAVIIVAQRVSSIMDCDNIIVLDDGKIVGSGTHQQLLETNKIYQEIVKSQLDPDEIESTKELMTQIKEEAK